MNSSVPFLKNSARTATLLLVGGYILVSLMLVTPGKAEALGGGLEIPFSNPFSGSTSQQDPTATLSGSLLTIERGESTTLSWSSTDATTCAGTGFSTGNARSGTVRVAPETTTRYMITCSREERIFDHEAYAAAIREYEANRARPEWREGQWGNAERRERDARYYNSQTGESLGADYYVALWTLVYGRAPILREGSWGNAERRERDARYYDPATGDLIGTTHGVAVSALTVVFGHKPEWREGQWGNAERRERDAAYYNPVTEERWDRTSYIDIRTGEAAEEPDRDDFYRIVSGPSITASFTVIVLPSGAPATPQIGSTIHSTGEGDSTVSVEGDACVVDDPFTLYLSTTDPQNDSIRYLVDWNVDGLVDAYAPASDAYATSGTMQEVSRTFTNSGEKRVRARAEDEHGNRSNWSRPYTFTCFGAGIPYAPSISTAEGSQCTPDEAQTVTVSASHPGNKDVYYELDWNRDGIADIRLPSTGVISAGTPLSTTHAFPAGDVVFSARTIDEDGATSNWVVRAFSCGATQEDCTVCTGGTPEVSLSAQPSLVSEGQSAELSWSIAGFDTLNACTLTGNNGDSLAWDTISSQSSYTTPGITRQTTYTLSCEYMSGTLTDTALIFLVPDWQEF